MGVKITGHVVIKWLKFGQVGLLKWAFANTEINKDKQKLAGLSN